MSNKIFLRIGDFFKNKDNLLIRLLVIFLLIIFTYFIIILQPISKVTNFKVGDILKEDIIAHNNIRYLDRKKTDDNIKKIKSESQSVFIFDYSITHKRLNSIIEIIDRLLILEDSLEIEQLLKNNSLKINITDIDIIRNLIDKDPSFIQKFSQIYKEISDNGIIEEIDLQNPNITVIINKNDTLIEKIYTGKEEINQLKLDFGALKDNIDKKFFQLSQKERYFIFSLLTKLIVPNILFDQEKTELKLKTEIEKRGNIYQEIKKNQIVGRKGDIISEENYDKILAIVEDINSELRSNFNFVRLLFIAILLLAFTFFCYFLVKNYESDFFKSISNVIFISIIFSIVIFLLNLPIYLGLDKKSSYYGIFIPISAITITLTFLYSKQISIIFVIIISILSFIISEYNFNFFLFLFFSGISSVFIITHITKRGDLLKAGIFISLINIFISVLIIFNNNLKEVNYFYYLIIAASNGILSSILAIGIIALGEIILNSPTVFRLHELSELSLPLMKELFNSAVGTYNHSILVGNLAEAAANGINGNALLARIGGYYHDIGKIDNAEYFIENQGDINIHNELKPSISVTIIKSHVKKGIEYAKRYKLPKKVIDIISQHHGNSLIKFFYEKALQMNDDNKEEVKEDFYKYNGEKPKFPESAIVMLADQVEAATRSLKKHTVNNIEKIVDDIIFHNYEDGQLDDSGLTLKDISRIKNIFTKLLIGMYHSRIEYQNKDKNQTSDESNNSDSKKEVI